MVRTKKHFRPPSPSVSSSSSEDDEDYQQAPTMSNARGMGKQLHFPSGGKQMSVMASGFRGGGKQLRIPAPQESDDDSDDSSDDDDDDEDEEVPSTTVTASYNRGGGGKQLMIAGGKQLRAPVVADEDENGSDDDSEEEEKEEEKTTYRPAGGKQFVANSFPRRGMGKQLMRPPTPDMSDGDSDSDESDDEDEEELPLTSTVVQPVQRGGKQLRPPTSLAATDKEESSGDTEESEEDEEVLEEKKEEKPSEPEPPVPVPKQKSTKATSKEVGEKEQTNVETLMERSSPVSSRPTRTTRSTKKIVDVSSESESESEEEFELDMESLDTQKLVEGDTDQKYLDSLPELEREAILAERFEKLKSEADMKKALRENKRKEKEQKRISKGKSEKVQPKKRSPSLKGKKEPDKKKAKSEVKIKEQEKIGDENEDVPDTSGDAALAESMAGKRVSTRNLDAKGNKFKRAAALAKIRENRASKTPTKETSDSDLDYGRDSDDSDDDYEESTMFKPWQLKEKKTTQLSGDTSDEGSVSIREQNHGQKREDVEAEVIDYVKVTIPRRRLMRWCNEPFFEEAVKHCYVRLGIGRDAKSQKACYRLCRIIGVECKGSYSFPPNEHQKSITTNKWLKVTFGKYENLFKMITASDHRPTADDVLKYVSQLKTERQSDNLLTRKYANKLLKRQDNLVNNYTYTQEDIERLVQEKKKHNKKAINIGLEKMRISIALQAAKDAVEQAKVVLEDAKVELMEADDSMIDIAQSNVSKAKEALKNANAILEAKIVEEQRIHKEESERSNRLKGSQKVQNWVKVNQKAKLANQNADFESYREQLAKEKAEASAEQKFDPFARRKVKPKNLWEVGTKHPSDKIHDANSHGIALKEKRDSFPTERDDSLVEKDDDKESKREESADIPGQSHQAGFDDDIMISGDIANFGIGLNKAITRTRLGISFLDYQAMKTAGTL